MQTHTHSVVAAHAPGGLCELVEIDLAVKAHRNRGDWARGNVLGQPGAVAEARVEIAITAVSADDVLNVRATLGTARRQHVDCLRVPPCSVANTMRSG